jgi:hypothetical protein
VLPWQAFTAIIGGLMSALGALFLLFARSLRNSYDARVNDLKAHNAETVAMLKDTLAVERVRADNLDPILAVMQTTEAVLKALPAGKAAV